MLTVCKLEAGPFLRVRVTAPEAPVQVMLKGVPAVIPAKVGSVNCTALATAKAAAARKTLANSILYELNGFETLWMFRDWDLKSKARISLLI